MMRQNQNSTGFLKTKRVSENLLIENVQNFSIEERDLIFESDEEMSIPERLMLGKRAERYFSEWAKRSSEYELIEENIQIIEEKKTLGEFDFIVRRKKDGQLMHIELVYKFYLFDPSAQGTEFQRWIGPNRRDKLDLKLDKLSNHQFPLFHSESARSKLSELGIVASAAEQYVLFLANLFVPSGVPVQFDQVNENAVEGTWMNLSDWKIDANNDSVYSIPMKKNWFSRSFESADWFTKDEALEQIKALHDQKRSPMIWSKDSNGIQRRDFVVFW